MGHPGARSLLEWEPSCELGFATWRRERFRATASRPAFVYGIELL